MRPFAIAGLQFDVRDDGDHSEQVAGRIAHLVKAFPWVQMVVLSELAVTGPKVAHAQPLPGPAEDRLRRVAQELGIWLVPGSLYEHAGEHIYNTVSVFNPAGEVVGRYRKMFPFHPYEPRVSAGDRPLVFDVPGIGRFGLSICYDMWFPETSRWLAHEGAEVILHPTLTNTIDRDVELAIVQATAAQNQCFVIDVNGIGEGGNGRSVMVGPAGEVLYLAGTHEQEIPLEIDLDRVSRSREVGLRGLGQPLKSFRDRSFDFPHYAAGARSRHLDALGPLEMPRRGGRAGLGGGGEDDAP